MSLPIDHARLPKPGDTFGEKYRLECILGSGGMGVVFGATHLITHKRVAIKWLAGEVAGGSLSDTTQRFVREARLAGEFHHPNIVQVYDLGESDGSFYMVMEWLEGESLAARLERVGRLSFSETTTWLIPCMHAMQRAHDAGIIHRDIKPANIFLCEATADRPALSKVLDFGISKRVTASSDMSTFVTKTGMLIGTPHYLSPEQLRARPVDRRTDIYGFGVLLYQTLAGELPFAADNFGDLVVEISVGTLRSLRELVPDLPVGVEQVVARAMAREPDQRYQTLHELIASLQALDPTPLTAATLPQFAAPSTMRPISTVVPHSAIRNGARERTLVTAATVASLLAAAVGFAVLQQDQSANDEPSAIVRPRELPSVVAPDMLPQSPFPQHDAAVDSGRPNGMEPVDTDTLQPQPNPHPIEKAPEPKLPVQTQPAQSGAPAKGPELKIAAPVKPSEPAKPVEPPKPKPASPARPTPTLDEFDQPAQPLAADPKPERNPLHMDIQ
jgi:serine/threonine protein kinase